MYTGYVWFNTREIATQRGLKERSPKSARSLTDLFYKTKGSTPLFCSQLSQDTSTTSTKFLLSWGVRLNKSKHKMKKRINKVEKSKKSTKQRRRPSLGVCYKRELTKSEQQIMNKLSLSACSGSVSTRCRVTSVALPTYAPMTCIHTSANFVAFINLSKIPLRKFLFLKKNFWHRWGNP